MATENALWLKVMTTGFTLIATGSQLSVNLNQKLGCLQAKAIIIANRYK
jgi:hypothetical protein